MPSTWIASITVMFLVIADGGGAAAVAGGESAEGHRCAAGERGKGTGVWPLLWQHRHVRLPPLNLTWLASCTHAAAELQHEMMFLIRTSHILHSGCAG